MKQKKQNKKVARIHLQSSERMEVDVVDFNLYLDVVKPQDKRKKPVYELYVKDSEDGYRYLAGRYKRAETAIAYAKLFDYYRSIGKYQHIFFEDTDEEAMKYIKLFMSDGVGAPLF